jgi:hypothetical protein
MRNLRQDHQHLELLICHVLQRCGTRCEARHFCGEAHAQIY